MWWFCTDRLRRRRLRCGGERGGDTIGAYFGVRRLHHPLGDGETLAVTPAQDVPSVFLAKGSTTSTGEVARASTSSRPYLGALAPLLAGTRRGFRASAQ